MTLGDTSSTPGGLSDVVDAFISREQEKLLADVKNVLNSVRIQNLDSPSCAFGAFDKSDESSPLDGYRQLVKQLDDKISTKLSQRLEKAKKLLERAKGLEDSRKKLVDSWTLKLQQEDARWREKTLELARMEQAETSESNANVSIPRINTTMMSTKKRKGNSQSVKSHIKVEDLMKVVQKFSASHRLKISKAADQVKTHQEIANRVKIVQLGFLAEVIEVCKKHEDLHKTKEKEMKLALSKASKTFKFATGLI